jgi:porphobilinogen deaminase
MFEEAIEALVRCIDRFETAGHAIESLSEEIIDAAHTAEQVVGSTNGDVEYAIHSLKQVPDEIGQLLHQCNIHIDAIMTWLETVKGAAV